MIKSIGSFCWIFLRREALVRDGQSGLKRYYLEGLWG
jgi:hypothetical protein